jgi:AbiV family abortive infection protein
VWRCVFDWPIAGVDTIRKWPSRLPLPSLSRKSTPCGEALVENAIALIADADLLYMNGRLARAYSFAILAAEEMSKIPALIACLDQLDKGNQPDWDDIAELLVSHYGKLMINELFFATQRSAAGLDATGSKQWQEAVQAAKDRNTRKQNGFYVGIDAGSRHDAGRGSRQGAREVRAWVARITFNMMELVNRAFTLRQHDPKAPIESNSDTPSWTSRLWSTDGSRTSHPLRPSLVEAQSGGRPVHGRTQDSAGT